MDGFTAGLILKAAGSVVAEQQLSALADLACQLNGDGAAPKVVAFIEARKGQTCKIKDTSHTGIVKGANMAKGGFYGGEKFPVLVEITESGMADAVGMVFEYELEQVEFSDVPLAA